MRTSFTNISGTHSPFSAGQGSQNLQSARPQYSQNAAVQQHFMDNFRPQAQQAAVEFDRANTGAAADYRQAATRAQNSAALSGLGLLNTQQANANQRDQAMQKMAYGWMNDMMSGGLLGGLL